MPTRHRDHARCGYDGRAHLIEVTESPRREGWVSQGINGLTLAGWAFFLGLVQCDRRNLFRFVQADNCQVLALDEARVLVGFISSAPQYARLDRLGLVCCSCRQKPTGIEAGFCVFSRIVSTVPPSLFDPLERVLVGDKSVVTNGKDSYAGVGDIGAAITKSSDRTPSCPYCLWNLFGRRKARSSPNFAIAWS